MFDLEEDDNGVDYFARRTRGCALANARPVVVVVIVVATLIAVAAAGWLIGAR